MAASPDCTEYLYPDDEKQAGMYRVEHHALDTTLFQQKNTNDWPMESARRWLEKG